MKTHLRIRLTTYLVLFCIAARCVGAAEAPCPLNPELIGKPANNLLGTYLSDETHTVAPYEISFELRNGIVTSATAKYPKAVTREMLRATLNEKFAAFEKKEKTGGVFAWRIIPLKVAIVVGVETDEGITIIMRSLDKEILGVKEKAEK
jgi:hypothetical protein